MEAEPGVIRPALRQLVGPLREPVQATAGLHVHTATQRRDENGCRRGNGWHC